MDDIDVLRKKKLEQLRAKFSETQAQNPDPVQEMDEEQQIALLEAAVREVLSREAVSRYNNLKLAHPEKALHALLIIGKAIQAGELKPGNVISDAMFKNLLLRLTPEKKEFHIKRV